MGAPSTGSSPLDKPFNLDGSGMRMIFYNPFAGRYFWAGWNRCLPEVPSQREWVRRIVQVISVIQHRHDLQTRVWGEGFVQIGRQDAVTRTIAQTASRKRPGIFVKRRTRNYFQNVALRLKRAQ